MSRKRKPTKPTGVIGPTRISVSPQGTNAEFQQLVFPTEKEEIEELIAHGFARAVGEQSSLGFSISSCLSNPQDDFDFSLTTSDGPKALELTEIAPLHQAGGSYKKVPSSYRTYDFSRSILNQILSKTEHYGGHPPKNLSLLLYITDWKFIPSNSLVQLLRYWCGESDHGFETVCWYCPITTGEGISFIIFPFSTEQLEGFDPETLRSKTLQNFDPREWTGGA